MENDNKQYLTSKNNKNKNCGQRVRSISPCLLRKDYIGEQFFSKKQSFNNQSNNLSQMPLYYQFFSKPQSILQQSQNNYLNSQNQTHLDRSKSNQVVLQGKGINLNQNISNSQQIQNENVYLLYQDVFNNEGNRFRCQTPNKWAKRLGTIRQKNENSYINTQIQQKKHIANQNKDLLILTNVLEKKQIGSNQQNNYQNKNSQKYSNLQTHQMSTSPQNDKAANYQKQNYKFNIERQNSSVMYTSSINPTLQFEESPEKSILIHSPKYLNDSQNRQKINHILQDSPPLGGETAHFNNFLQNAQLESYQKPKLQIDEQSRKLSFGQNESNKQQNNQKDSQYCKQSLDKNQSQNYQNQNNYLFSRSITPSSRPLTKTQDENLIQPIIKQRKLLKLNKSNLSVFAERNNSPNQSISKKRIQTQGNDDKQYDDLDDSLFVQYNDENLFKNCQQVNTQKLNHSKKNISTIKDTSQYMIQTENVEEINQSYEKQFNVKSIRNQINNPSVVQYTSKSTMQRYSKAPRFISVKNRIIRYPPALMNIMQNTTTDHTFEKQIQNK